MSDFVERQVFVFQCIECHKPNRQSVRVDIAKARRCRKCRSQNHVPKGQMSILDEPLGFVKNVRVEDGELKGDVTLTKRGEEFKKNYE